MLKVVGGLECFGFNKRKKERERERERGRVMGLGLSKSELKHVLQTNPQKPHNRWGAYWPGGFTRPLYPGKERRVMGCVYLLIQLTCNLAKRHALQPNSSPLHHPPQVAGNRRFLQCAADRNHRILLPGWAPVEGQDTSGRIRRGHAFRGLLCPVHSHGIPAITVKPWTTFRMLPVVQVQPFDQP